MRQITWKFSTIIHPIVLMVVFIGLQPGTAFGQDCGQELRDAQDMVDAFPDDPQAFETLGEAQICKKECVAAWNTLSRAVKMGSPASVMTAAETCMKRLVVNGPCEDAAREARRLVEAAPKSAFAHTMLAQALTCQNSCAERLVVLSNAVKLGADPNLMKDADLSCIDRLIEQKSCDRALEEIEQVLPVFPKSANLRLSQARAQICSGECAKAWDSFDRAGKLGADLSNNQEAQQCVASVIRSGECEKGQIQAKQIVDARPKNADAHALYAEAMVCSGSCIPSYIAWNKAAQLGASESLKERGPACLQNMQKKGQCGEANAEIQTLLKSYPRNAELYALLGDGATCQQDCVSAWSAYKNASKYGAAAEVVTRGTQCLADLTNNGNCEQSLSQALAIAKADPQSAEPIWAIGEARYCAEDYRGALADFQRFESRGGDSERAQSGITKARSHLASLTIRIQVTEEGTKPPKPTIEGLAAEQIVSLGEGVYQALDVNPVEVQVSIAPGDNFWPIERTIRLVEGAVEEIELKVMRAVYSNLKVGDYAPELELSILDPRSGETLSLEAGAEIQIPAGSSELNIRMPAGTSDETLEIPIDLTEGTQQLPLPWGWRIVDPDSGQVMSSGISIESDASVSFEANLPIALRPAPMGSHESVINGTAGNILNYQMNLNAHPSFEAFDALQAFQDSGRQDKIMHWSLLGAATLLEGIAIAQFRTALNEADSARGITDPRMSNEYAEAVSKSRRSQAFSAGLAITGGAAFGASWFMTRPKVRGRSDRTLQLERELKEAIQHPIAIEPIDSKEFSEKTALFDPSRPTPVRTRPSPSMEQSDIDDKPIVESIEHTPAKVEKSTEDSVDRLRVSMGFVLTTLETTSAPDLGLQWTITGGAMPRFALRIERPIGHRLSLMGTVYATPKYAIINGGNETFTESLFTLAARYSIRTVGPVDIAPQVALGGLQRKIAPEGAFDLHNITPVVDAGVNLRMPLGDLPLSLYTDVSYLQDLSELSSNAEVYATSSGLQGMLGLSLDF